MRREILSLLLAGFVVLFGFSGLQAANIGVTFTGGTSEFSQMDVDVIIGYAFTPVQTVWVSSLGVYDHDGDGLDVTHDVGIWGGNGSPELLAQTTVDAGSGSRLRSGFRFESIAPLQLDPGTTYYLGAAGVTNSQDDWVFVSDDYPGTVTIAPEIDYLNPSFYLNAYEAFTGLSNEVAPVMVGGGQGFFGANMEFNTTLRTSSVPVPAAVWLLGSGLVGLITMRRKIRA